MTAKFEVTSGELPWKLKYRKKRIDTDALVDFWDEIGTAQRKGVYVFGVRAGRGWRPLYVGRTKKQTFKKRIGQHANTGGRFNRILKDVTKGTPWLFLIGRVGKGRSSNAAINDLESEFINYAFARNEDLDNDRGIKTAPYQIRGFGGKGKPAERVKWLKQMIGYK